MYNQNVYQDKIIHVIYIYICMLISIFSLNLYASKAIFHHFLLEERRESKNIKK